MVNHVSHKLTRCMLDGNNSLTPAPQSRSSQLVQALLVSTATLHSVRSCPSHVLVFVSGSTKQRHVSSPAWPCLPVKTRSSRVGVRRDWHEAPRRRSTRRAGLLPGGCAGSRRPGVPLPAPRVSLTGQMPPWLPGGRRGPTGGRAELATTYREVPRPHRARTAHARLPASLVT